jgi:hypothetical protein
VKLPNAGDVQVDEAKIRGYLLSRSHPVGRFKARVFAALGFDESSSAAFAAELRRIARTGEVAEQEENAYGRKYTVPGELNGPTGSARVVTVWFRAAGEPHVRLVTVHPRQ